MELKRHASYWMNWKRWEHLNGRDRDWEDLTSCTLRKCFENLTHTDFWYLQVLNSKNQNLIRLIITILILIISILSYQEVKKHHYGWDTMDFNDNVRKDFNYG